MKEHSNERPHLYPDIQDWPIYKFHARRRALVKELEAEAFTQLTRHGGELVDLLQTTVYSEKNRIRQEPWKVDPPDEASWWRRIQRTLLRAGLNVNSLEERAQRQELLRTILRRYAEEVVGTFSERTFQFARRFLTLAFNRLLNTAAGRNLRRLARAKVRLRDRLIVSGQVERVRKLFPDHHIVILPTHFSNMDSMLIGYALDAFAGLPHTTFGAGLNLLNSGYVAYFINRMGAYRVDRRKKNPVYLEVLKSFSRLAIYQGVNSTFFPGGTRSRSGHIEREVKLGLLGTAVEAQRRLLAEGSDKKVIVVPLVLSYHFVLEAKYLIEDHLRRTGREQYLGRGSDAFSYRTFVRFLWQLFSSSSEIYLNLGQPLDVLGNPVDDAGVSRTAAGTRVDLVDYFKRDGAVVTDVQREREYTKLLGEAVVDRFHRDNVVLTSHIVAFVAFRMLRQFHPELDLYGTLRLPEDEFLFDVNLVISLIGRVQKRLEQLEQDGRVHLSGKVRGAPEEVLSDGVNNMQLYHALKPLSLEGDRLVSEDFHLLFYYHNRLTGYPLIAASKVNFEGNVLSVRAARIGADLDDEDDRQTIALQQAVD